MSALGFFQTNETHGTSKDDFHGNQLCILELLNYIESHDRVPLIESKVRYMAFERFLNISFYSNPSLSFLYTKGKNW